MLATKVRRCVFLTKAFYEPRSVNHQVSLPWGDFERSAHRVQVPAWGSLAEALSFPPLEPGRLRLNKRIPDKPAPDLTSEGPQTSSKTNCCSNLFSFFRSTLWGDREMAKTVSVVKESVRLQTQEVNRSLKD